jgi:BirA family transcriptional regulator, biotin operon repressor / biotin---[acetyl-CoA-carboxylase] ligase
MRRLHSWHGRDDESWRRQWHVPRLRIYHGIGSTNSLALRLAQRGAPHGTLILAEQQSRGRGRRGRHWHAPAGKALLLSFLARPERATAPGTTPVRVGAIVAESIEACTGIEARIKWPNDVLAPDGRKLAGILCEGAVADGGGYIVAGIGINVSQAATDFAPELRDRATSLTMAGARRPDRPDLIADIVRRLLDARRIAEPFTRDERSAIDARHAFHRTLVHVDGETGTVFGILEDGALAIRGAAGQKNLHSGTLRYARQTGNPAHAQP